MEGQPLSPSPAPFQMLFQGYGGSPETTLKGRWWAGGGVSKSIWKTFFNFSKKSAETLVSVFRTPLLDNTESEAQCGSFSMVVLDEKVL